MALDITVLRLLRSRERFERLAHAVPSRALEPRTAVILKDYAAYFEEFPDCNEIEPGAFTLWFVGFRHRKLTDEAAAVFKQILSGIDKPVDPAIEAGLMARLVEADTAARVTDLLERYTEGQEIDLYASLRDSVENHEVQVDRKVKNPQVLDPIEDILAEEENDFGMHFRQSVLDRHIKPLKGGDFLVMAARPDKGKSSFIADAVTFMAPQVDKLWPGENRSILWLNNEGPGRRIVSRTFQAAGGWTVEEMVALNKLPASGEFAERYKTKLREAYAAALGGRPGVLRVFDIHGMWNHEVEELLRIHRPALVVFDMIDNIKFGGELANGGSRTDQILETMYQWARLLAVKYDCAAIATSQISADGDGLQFPTLPMLKDSKTGKQGAADVILTMGAVNDPMLATSRYFGCTKNKRGRTGVASSPDAEIIFDKDRSRFLEPPVQ